MTCKFLGHIDVGLLILLLVVAMFSSCSSETEVEITEMPVRISIPVNESSIARRNMPQEMGDPGTTEMFAFPEHAYIYLVCEVSGGTKIISKTEDLVLSPDKWVKETYSGAFAANGDQIYRYTGTITLGIPKENRTAGRVYAALSSVPLSVSSPSTEDEITNLQFDLDAALQEDLQNLYSSPYNYNNTDGDYYGTVDNITSKIPSVNLVLYHVASKVDLMWNVQTDMQSKMKIKDLTVKNLYSGPCYLFRPRENVVGAEKLTTGGYNLTLATDNVGTWWQGREYIYTIPYNNNDSPSSFPLQMEFSIGDTDAATTVTYNLTLKKNMTGSSEVFVPWIRSQMLFTSVKSGEETIEIN